MIDLYGQIIGVRVKTKSPLKIIFIAFLAFTIVLSGAIFYASKKLKPDELKQIMVTQLEAAFPNSIVKTSSVDFSLGLTSVLNIHGVDITLKKPRAFPLLKLDNLRLEIPFWAILFGGGKIELVANSPKVNYIEFDKTSNWVFAMSGKKENIDVKTQTKSDTAVKKADEEDNLVIPGFIAASELNIKVQNLELEYKLADKSSGQVNVEKLLLKDVGVKSTTAFELKSALDLLKGTTNHTKLELLVIGESHLFNYIKNKELEIKSQVILSNIENSHALRPIKNLSMNSTLHLKKDKSIQVDFVSSLEEKQILKGRFENKQGISKIKDIELSFIIKDLLELVVALDQIPVLFSGNEQFELNGDVVLGENIQPNFDFKTTKQLKVKQNSISVDIGLSGSVRKNGLTANVDIDAFSGKVNAKAFLNTNWKPESFSNLSPVDISVIARDMKIDPSKLMVSDSAAKNNENTETKERDKTKKEKNVAIKPTIIPVPMKVKVQLENILLGEAKLSGDLDIVGAQKGIKVTSNNIKLDDGKIDMGATISVVGKDLKNSFDLKLVKLNLSSLASLLPKGLLEAISGEANGEVKGHTIGDKYFANISMKLFNGRLDKVNVGQFVEGLIDKLGPLKDKVDPNKLKINGEFSSFVFKGAFDNSRHQITSSEFIDKGHKVNLQSSGNIYLLGGKQSALDLNLKITDAKISKDLKNSIGTDTFPISLNGVGYALSPDYSRTIKTIGKSALKEQGTQQLKKLLKGKDPKKLLKGLFK